MLPTVKGTEYTLPLQTVGNGVITRRYWIETRLKISSANSESYISMSDGKVQKQVFPAFQPVTYFFFLGWYLIFAALFGRYPKALASPTSWESPTTNRLEFHSFVKWSP